MHSGVERRGLLENVKKPKSRGDHMIIYIVQIFYTIIPEHGQSRVLGEEQGDLCPGRKFYRGPKYIVYRNDLIVQNTIQQHLKNIYLAPSAES